MAIKQVNVKLHTFVCKISIHEHLIYHEGYKSFINLEKYWGNVCEGFLGYTQLKDNTFRICYEEIEWQNMQL